MVANQVLSGHQVCFQTLRTWCELTDPNCPDQPHLLPPPTPPDEEFYLAQPWLLSFISSVGMLLGCSSSPAVSGSFWALALAFQLDCRSCSLRCFVLIILGKLYPEVVSYCCF